MFVIYVFMNGNDEPWLFQGPCYWSKSLFSELSCVCDSKSVTQYDFDNILQRPICEKVCEKPSDCLTPTPNVSDSTIHIANNASATNNKSKCHLKQMNYTIYSSHRINVQIYQSSNNNPNSGCTCNQTSHAIYLHEFCVPLKLLSEYQQYQSFKSNPLYGQMKFLMLFCHLVKNQTACQQLANLCILSHYSMNRNSPCHQFYTTQTSEIAAINYNERMRPFLFYRKGKYASELFDKALDFQYNMEDDMVIKWFDLNNYSSGCFFVLFCLWFWCTMAINTSRASYYSLMDLIMLMRPKYCFCYLL